MAPNPFETSGRSIPPPPIPPGVSLVVRTQLEIALAQYGVRETSRNRGPMVDEYIRGVDGRGGYLLGKPWCGRFARWPIDMAAQRLKIPSPLPRDRDLASGIKWLEWGEENGKIIAVAEPGAIAVLRGEGAQSHVYTVVDSILDEDQTVEGNTGPHADCVDCRARASFLVSGYIRVW